MKSLISRKGAKRNRLRSGQAFGRYSTKRNGTYIVAAINNIIFFYYFFLANRSSVRLEVEDSCNIFQWKRDEQKILASLEKKRQQKT